MREWIQNAVFSYSPSPAMMRPPASRASRLDALTSLQCRPYRLRRNVCPSASITLKWLQTPSCRSRRTASRNAAARSIRAARSSAVAVISVTLPMGRDYRIADAGNKKGARRRLFRLLVSTTGAYCRNWRRLRGQRNRPSPHRPACRGCCRRSRQNPPRRPPPRRRPCRPFHRSPCRSTRKGQACRQPHKPQTRTSTCAPPCKSDDWARGSRATAQQEDDKQHRDRHPEQPQQDVPELAFLTAPPLLQLLHASLHRL